MTEFRDTLDILSRLRKVKYGDVVLSSDHNDLVDSVNALFDLILPSRINPYDFVYEPHYLFNFLEPEFSGQTEEERAFIRATVTKPSLVTASRYGDGIIIGLSGVKGVGEPLLPPTRIAVCLKYIKREKKPVVNENPYESYIFGLSLGLANGYKQVVANLGYAYNEELDAILSAVEREGRIIEVTRIPDDWHVVVLDLPSEKAYIYDRNGKILGETIVDVSSTDTFCAVICGGVRGENEIYPNEVNIDWVIF